MADSTESTVTRTSAVPPEAVFDAWATPASFAFWWGGPDIEIPLDSLSLDVRPGGSWRATMILGNGMPDFHWRGEYLEVDRPHKLVMTMTDEPGDARELLTVVLTEVDGGTRMEFSQTGGHLTAEQYKGTTTGWKIAFDALDAVLAA